MSATICGPWECFTASSGVRDLHEKSQRARGDEGRGTSLPSAPAGSVAGLELDPEQLLWEPRPARLLRLGQVVLDLWPQSILPRPLEAVGFGVGPGSVGGRDFGHGL